MKLIRNDIEEEFYYSSNDRSIEVYTTPSEDYKRNTGLIDSEGLPIYVIEKKYRLGYI